MQVWSRASPIYRVVEGNPDSPRGKKGRNKNGIGSRSTPHESKEMAAKDSENSSPMTYSWVDVETTYEVRVSILTEQHHGALCTAVSI